MKIIEKLIRVIVIFVVIFYIVILQIPYREKIDRSIAEDLLREVYMPLEDFVKAGTSVEGEDLFQAHSDIKNKDDFTRLFNNKIENRMIDEFYQDLVVEKGGVVYIDKKIYIPTVYAENSILTKSYIRKNKSSLYSYITGINDIKEDKLIIKEKWKISGEWFRRTNYFVNNKNGEWILEDSTGIGMYGFVDSNDNPWTHY